MLDTRIMFLAATPASVRPGLSPTRGSVVLALRSEGCSPVAETTPDAPASAPTVTAAAAATLHSSNAPRRGPRVGVRSDLIEGSFG